MLVTFIGGGNMATALISGLVNPPRAHIRLRVSDPNEQARRHLEDTFGAATYTDTVQAVTGAAPHVNPMHTSSDIRNPMVEAGIPAHKLISITNYDGMPLTASYVVEHVGKHLSQAQVAAE